MGHFYCPLTCTILDDTVSIYRKACLMESWSYLGPFAELACKSGPLCVRHGNAIAMVFCWWADVARDCMLTGYFCLSFLGRRRAMNWIY